MRQVVAGETVTVRALLLVMLLALCSGMGIGLVQAQPGALAGAVTLLNKLEWEQTNVPDAVSAQAMTFAYYADGATVGVPLSGVTCTGAAPVVCTGAFPAFTPGAHSIVMTAKNAAGESLKSAPPVTFTFVVVPSAPTNIRFK